ncbi:MAG TPA: hypothetical protein VJZ16_00265 [Syntrophales bacterium]|nr:MAG: hypothetical protein A2052_08965 [Deltaproteobacteria bacterium GWA2_54_12]HLA04390.1 hypothetical protein [Syntrophales bacterium]
MQTTINRKYFEFPEMVEHHFRFLEQELGFIMVEASETFIQYRSQLFFVNIYHGRQSYEVGFEVGRIDEAPLRYGLSALLMVVVPEYNGNTFFQARDKKTLQKSVERLAQIVKAHCHYLLMGDLETWKKLENIRQLEKKQLHQNYFVRPTKNEALGAWQRRDYEEVICKYETIETDLTEIERRRLACARKKIKEIKE